MPPHCRRRALYERLRALSLSIISPLRLSFRAIFIFTAFATIAELSAFFRFAISPLFRHFLSLLSVFAMRPLFSLSIFHYGCIFAITPMIFSLLQRLMISPLLIRLLLCRPDEIIAFAAADSLRFRLSR
jgi:hypothetical protein